MRFVFIPLIPFDTTTLFPVIIHPLIKGNIFSHIPLTHFQSNLFYYRVEIYAARQEPQIFKNSASYLSGIMR